MDYFDLTERPWINVRLVGERRISSVSLEQAITGAHQVQGIWDPSPVTAHAIHRLLLAVTHRVFGPPSSDAWRSLYAAGSFDPATVRAYLGRWRARLRLFDPERPFLQRPGLEPKLPATTLVFERASGNTVRLFDHTIDASAPPLSPGEAARALVAFQTFAVAHGPSGRFKDGPWTRGISMRAEGSTLFESLVLSMVRYTNERPIPWTGDDDAPAWEQDAPVEIEAPRAVPAGYCDYLTWQPRALLLAERDGSVAQVAREPGLALPTEFTSDPLRAFVETKKGIKPLRPRPGRALWRDSHALIEQGLRRGDLISWLANVVGGRRPSGPRATPRLVLVALETNQGAVTGSLAERVSVPDGLLNDKSRRDRLGDALAQAEGCGRSIHKATWMLSKDEETTIPGGLGEPAYWARLDAPFQRLAARLADTDDLDGATAWWSETTYRLARECSREVASALEWTGSGLRAGARFEFNVARSLRKLAPEPATTKAVAR